MKISTIVFFVSIIATFILYGGPTNLPPVPGIIFGVICIGSGLISIFSKAKKDDEEMEDE